jgi:hypothetical protein
MDITTGISRSTRRLVVALMVAFALAAATLLVMQQQPAEAQIGGGLGNLFQSIVCPILIAIRNAFAGGPFGDFVTTLLNQFLVAFGCAPSG